MSPLLSYEEIEELVRDKVPVAKGNNPVYHAVWHGDVPVAIKKIDNSPEKLIQQNVEKEVTLHQYITVFHLIFIYKGNFKMNILFNLLDTHHSKKISFTW